MSKRALLIGCNYPGTEAELNGCVNDVFRMKKTLLSRFGFDEQDIVVMIDTDKSYPQPTGANIRNALSKIINNTESGDVLFMHYSGHGTRVPPETGAEDDTGYDECIVPTDMNVLSDNDFRDLVNKLPDGVSFTFVTDCCHSGGLIDHAKEQIGDSVVDDSDAPRTRSVGVKSRDFDFGGGGRGGRREDEYEERAPPRGGYGGRGGREDEEEEGRGGRHGRQEYGRRHGEEEEGEFGRHGRRHDEDEEEEHEGRRGGRGGHEKKHHGKSDDSDEEKEERRGGRGGHKEKHHGRKDDSDEEKEEHRGGRRDDYGGGYGGETIYGRPGREEEEERHGYEGGYGGGKGGGRSRDVAIKNRSITSSLLMSMLKSKMGIKSHSSAGSEGVRSLIYSIFGADSSPMVQSFAGIALAQAPSILSAMAKNDQSGSLTPFLGMVQGLLGQEEEKKPEPSGISGFFSKMTGGGEEEESQQKQQQPSSAAASGGMSAMLMSILQSQSGGSASSGGGMSGLLAMATPLAQQVASSGEHKMAYAGYKPPVEQRVREDMGILVSGCQSDETSADASPDSNPENAYGALSNAIQEVLAERNGSIASRDLVLEVKKKLRKGGFEQNPGLYCSDRNSRAYFICEV